jgi:putative ABC transport system permease protein
MNLYSAWKIAYRSLRANRLRSFLTMLGMVIGVASVIAMVAIGAGASERIAARIASLGSNLLIIIPGSTTAGGLRSGFGSTPTLTMGDALAIGKELPAIRLAAPSIRSISPVVHRNQNWTPLVRGVTPEYFEVQSWRIAEGRFFTSDEVDTSSKAAVVGQTVVEKLFGEESPIGTIIRIKRVPFKVIGVLEEKGRSPWGQDQDDIIMAPITTVRNKLSGSEHPGMVEAIFAQAVDRQSIAEAEREVRALLQQRHRIGNGKEEDFSVRNLTEMLEAEEASTRIMSLLLGMIASVSLLVGGIGIMNIMLVSVTERTREIGIRLAVGARERDILVQFLIEAVSLSAAGGVAGILFGVGGSMLISRFAGWSTLISPGAVLLAFGFSAAVGIFFGFYPARKASRLDPIEALRHE